MKRAIKILVTTMCLVVAAAIPIYAEVYTTQSITVAETMESVNTEGRQPETEEVMIERLSLLDEEGNVSLTITTTEDVALPVAVTMKGRTGSIQFNLNRNGQVIKIPPDDYQITKVIDGNSKKLDDGAYLSIVEESSHVFLDFTNPNKTNTLLEFVIHNILFIPALIIMYVCFRIYKKNKI